MFTAAAGIPADLEDRFQAYEERTNELAEELRNLGEKYTRVEAENQALRSWVSGWVIDLWEALQLQGERTTRTMQNVLTTVQNDGERQKELAEMMQKTSLFLGIPPPRHAIPYPGPSFPTAMPAPQAPREITPPAFSPCQTAADPFVADDAPPAPSLNDTDMVPLNALIPLQEQGLMPAGNVVAPNPAVTPAPVESAAPASDNNASPAFETMISPIGAPIPADASSARMEETSATAPVVEPAPAAGSPPAAEPAVFPAAEDALTPAAEPAGTVAVAPTPAPAAAASETTTTGRPRRTPSRTRGPSRQRSPSTTCLGTKRALSALPEGPEDMDGQVSKKQKQI